ncbi:MAG: gliding motility-associated C-terminal domain-containing protein [Bacteroidales bacterium]|nr:gliding motility-associated C-terminal domain-containing protein [Bacteroidales bacterium]
MKRSLLTLAILLLTAFSALGQSLTCWGWKNPLHFSFYNDTVSGQYSGYTGNKLGLSCTSCADNSCYDWVDSTFLDSNSYHIIHHYSSYDITIPNYTGAPLTLYGADMDTIETRSTDTLSGRYCVHHGYGMLEDSLRWRIMNHTEGPGTGALIGLDPLTDFNLPYCPPGFERSIRIGQCRYGAQSEAVNYTFRVTNNSRLLTIWYAIVAQAPGHGIARDPIFKIRVMHRNAVGEWQPMTDTLCYTVSTTPATILGGNVVIGENGWHNLYDTVLDIYGNPHRYEVYYRDWNKAVINLSRYLYETVRIEVSMTDCAYVNGHYGYCYIAGECGPITITSEGCVGGGSDTVGRINATPGLQGYEWYYSHDGLLLLNERTVESHYTRVEGADDSIFYSMQQHFFTDAGEQVDYNTFKCVMISYIDPDKPIRTDVYVDMQNNKPRQRADSALYCDGRIWLKESSMIPYDMGGAIVVDSSRTEWTFYDTVVPIQGHVVERDTGVVGTHLFDSSGYYCVTQRTFNSAGGCWSQRTIPVHALTPPDAAIGLSDNNVCKGSMVTLTDLTPGAVFRRWTFHTASGDRTVESFSPVVQFIADEETHVTLETHTDELFLQDTNDDGTPDSLYCYGTADTVISLLPYVVVSYTGDVICCSGVPSMVTAVTDLQGCHFDWYNYRNETTPIESNSATLHFTTTTDRWYYVKITTPALCTQWDSVRVHVALPTISTSRQQICTGDSTTLWTQHDLPHSWSSQPADPSLAGQESADTVIVAPSVTTTYKVGILGVTACTPTAVTTINVVPYPIMEVELKPDYIDLENPMVQFSDNSQYGATSLWDFGDGTTSTARTVVHQYSDFSQDSLLVALQTGNVLGCTSDTSFWLQVGKFAVWFPNVITPDQGTNREFMPYTVNTLYNYELYIYDRGGDLVFSSSDPNEAWDGTHNGRKCPQAAYVWVLRYCRVKDGNPTVNKGTVMVLR